MSVQDLPASRHLYWVCLTLIAFGTLALAAPDCDVPGYVFVPNKVPCLKSNGLDCNFWKLSQNALPYSVSFNTVKQACDASAECLAFSTDKFQYRLSQYGEYRTGSFKNLGISKWTWSAMNCCAGKPLAHPCYKQCCGTYVASNGGSTPAWVLIDTTPTGTEWGNATSGTIKGRATQCAAPPANARSAAICSTACRAACCTDLVKSPVYDPEYPDVIRRGAPCTPKCFSCFAQASTASAGRASFSTIKVLSAPGQQLSSIGIVGVLPSKKDAACGLC